MKHFIKPDGSIWAFEDDGSQDDLITSDMSPLSDQQVASIRAAQSQPTQEQIIESYTASVQSHLDTTARQKGYDGILSACTYATSTVDRFRREGQACVEWRDAVWSSCYAMLDQVLGGHMAAPTVDQLLAQLPEMEWPV